MSNHHRIVGNNNSLGAVGEPEEEAQPRLRPEDIKLEVEESDPGQHQESLGPCATARQTNNNQTVQSQLSQRTRAIKEEGREPEENENCGAEERDENEGTGLEAQKRLKLTEDPSGVVHTGAKSPNNSVSPLRENETRIPSSRERETGTNDLIDTIGTKVLFDFSHMCLFFLFFF